ncbi:serine/threonine-protein kinase [Streptomyces sp. NPDC051018]|uniref:serine/threonine-protein kinase n=1 Tax=Streptomyces sp. NPDC051018 TaxID=3365639 RepID=UPI0037999994
MDQLVPGDPQHIGGYRLLARLGAGGMGQVFLARSDRGRTVAVKLVRQELAAQETFRERFRQEVRSARRVGGQWTAPVLDADTEAPVPWVATGYVAGPPLNAVVSGDHGPLPERSVRILAAGLAHALGSIHTAGLIHRDLKPSNIMITIDGPRVIDFGIARALETAADGGLTRTGALVGSPGFMAPEQVRGEPLTPAADIFCLGSVLMYAATGRLPFGTAQSAGHALMFRIAEEEPDLTGLPIGLYDLVQHCLDKFPGRRPGLEEILARTATQPSHEPWLPGALIAQLGRHAVQLLEVEHAAPAGAPVTPSSHAPAAGAAAPAHHPAQPPALNPAPDRGPGPGSRPAPAPGRSAAPGPGPAPRGGGSPSPPRRPEPAPYSPPTTTRSRRAPADRGRVAALVGIGAAVIAVLAVAAVRALGDGKDPADDPKQGSSASTTPRASSGTVPPADGHVPAHFLGTWRATFETADGSNERLMTIIQGRTDETVMTLTGSGPSYDCTWSAKLQSSETDLNLGPTKVLSGDPTKCSPGQWSRLEMPDSTTIVRELVGSSGAPLRYTKQQ